MSEKKYVVGIGAVRSVMARLGGRKEADAAELLDIIAIGGREALPDNSDEALVVLISLLQAGHLPSIRLRSAHTVYRQNPLWVAMSRWFDNDSEPKRRFRRLLSVGIEGVAEDHVPAMSNEIEMAVLNPLMDLLEGPRGTHQVLTLLLEVADLHEVNSWLHEYLKDLAKFLIMRVMTRMQSDYFAYNGLCSDDDEMQSYIYPDAEQDSRDESKIIALVHKHLGVNLFADNNGEKNDR